MKKYIGIGLVGVLFTGCAFTSSQVAEQVNKQQQKQYQQYVQAKAEAVKAVMDALAKIDRGGMQVELDETGRVKAIRYTERLDTDVLKQALVTAQPKMYVPKSGLEEFGNFFLKFGSFATPVASLWLNYKTTKSNNWARVKITESNNQAQADMYNAFTSNFKNETVTNTSVVTTNIDKETNVKESVFSKENSVVSDKSVINNNEKEVQSVKVSNTDTAKEIITTNNNNNNGGNQNIGETNTIVPQGVIEGSAQNNNEDETTNDSAENNENNDVENNGESQGDMAPAEDSDEIECLPGAPC